MKLFSPNLIIENLKNHAPIFEGRIFEAMSEKIEIHQTQTPMALVIVSAEDDEFARQSLKLEQDYSIKIRIVTIIRNEVLKNDFGSETAIKMREARGQVFDALLGKASSSRNSRLLSLGGKILDKTVDDYRWRDNFSTKYFIKQE